MEAMQEGKKRDGNDGWHKQEGWRHGSSHWWGRTKMATSPGVYSFGVSDELAPLLLLDKLWNVWIFQLVLGKKRE